MISRADQKAALAWLDLIGVHVERNDAHAIIVACAGAIEFYRNLRPETPGEFEALGYGVDSIAFAQIHALALLGLDDARREFPG